MNTQEINKEIECGVRVTLRFASRSPAPDEMDDYVQDAWVRYLSTSDSEEKANPRLCSKRSTAASMRRWTTKTKPLDSIFEQQPEVERPTRPAMPEFMRSALLEEFQQQRRKGGVRGLLASARDLAILNLLWQGYSDNSICAQLEMPHYSLRTYRRQIKERLRHMLERKRGEAREYCPAWASSGLRHFNFNKEG